MYPVETIVTQLDLLRLSSHNDTADDINDIDDIEVELKLMIELVILMIELVMVRIEL